MERTKEESAEIFTLGNRDAFAGRPKRFVLIGDSDYEEGWDETKAFMKQTVESEGRNLRRLGIVP